MAVIVSSLIFLLGEARERCGGWLYTNACDFVVYRGSLCKRPERVTCFFSPSSLVSCPITRAHVRISDVEALCLHRQLEPPAQLIPRDAECIQQKCRKTQRRTRSGLPVRPEAAELNYHPQRLYRSGEAPSLKGRATARHCTFADQRRGLQSTRRPRLWESPGGGARHSVHVPRAGTHSTNYAWEPSSVVHTVHSPAASM